MTEKIKNKIRDNLKDNFSLIIFEVVQKYWPNNIDELTDEHWAWGKKN